MHFFLRLILLAFVVCKSEVVLLNQNRLTGKGLANICIKSYSLDLYVFKDHAGFSTLYDDSLIRLCLALKLYLNIKL